ncbi:hypothetical protein BDN72DRAFT_836275 [Pluteus cervinus]|uniref:Uncharacterized protein n=1 Tax=Pluteus cervinus TaxID=181527 RepID=A0ACD3B2R3_9AGAR|nr:hypothetical protein BDN72DRAFT_836275 [Pluteus cervinus]
MSAPPSPPHIMMPHLYPNLSSFSLRGLPLEDAYTQIDREISQTEDHLCSLKTRRNSLSPISKIPIELLSKIFSESQELALVSLPDEVDLDMRFIVSWVCRHWRATALGTPGLWTIISKKNKDSAIDIDFARDFLMRSRNRGISVNLFRSPQNMLEAFVPQMHRITQLRLSDIPPNPEFGKLLSQPAPALSTIELCGIHLPLGPILSGNHPNLRSLIIADMDFAAFSPSILPGLTRLHIVGNDPNMTPNYLLGALDSMQALEELKLVRCLQDRPVLVPANRLRLRSLQSVTISDKHSTAVFGLLGRLDVPQADITVTWPEEIDCSPMTMEDFFFALEEYQSIATFPIRHLKVERYFPNFVIEIASTRSQYRYSFRFPTQEFKKEDTDEFISALSLDHLETLSTTELPRDTLETLKGLTRLSSVTLYGESAVRKFARELDLGRPETRADSDSSETSFPAVDMLTVCNIECAELHDLENALATRHKAKMGLGGLVFVGCPDVDVEGFRDLVGIISVYDD